MHGIKPREKYPESVRKFCLTMHYHSPRTYEFLRNSFDNRLPHSSTISAWYANSDLNTQANSINSQCLSILKKKSQELYAKTEEKLVVALLFDEIHIMKHVQWSNSNHKLVGYVNENEIGIHSSQQLDVANQALVFIVNGVNYPIQLPIAYYFIKKMDGDGKKKLVGEIIGHLIDCDLIVSNVTFDGFQANKKMCALFGANLKVNSPEFKPYFKVRDQQVHIFFDACHMIKLIRNRLASKGILIDYEGNKIYWQYFVDLVQKNDHGYCLTHKMSKKHIEWWHKKMKVDLAVETLSESTASSIEFLLRKNIPEFVGAEATIKFIRVWNRLFDIFNSKKEQNEDMFKSVLSQKNADEIFKFFEYAIKYIKGLKVENDKGNLIFVHKSRLNTGFNGFIIDMISLKHLFQNLVQNHIYTKTIKTYCLQQDPVEIFFGKVRSLGGSNDNPTCEHFSSAFRKLLAYSTVMYSKNSNCIASEDLTSNPNSNILHITSKREKNTQLHDLQVSEEDIDQFYEKLNEIQNLERSKDLTEELNEYTIAHAACIIEERVKVTKHFKCSECRSVFEENVKADNKLFMKTKSSIACESTFMICKQTDRFLKLELLAGSIDFKVIYHEILKSMDFATLYENTDFSSHIEHKVFLIRYVIDEYVRIKGTHMAKQATFKEREHSIRVRLHKLMHYLGQ